MDDNIEHGNDQACLPTNPERDRERGDERKNWSDIGDEFHKSRNESEGEIRLEGKSENQGNHMESHKSEYKNNNPQNDLSPHPSGKCVGNSGFSPKQIFRETLGENIIKKTSDIFALQENEKGKNSHHHHIKQHGRDTDDHFGSGLSERSNIFCDNTPNGYKILLHHGKQVSKIQISDRITENGSYILGERKTFNSRCFVSLLKISKIRDDGFYQRQGLFQKNGYYCKNDHEYKKNNATVYDNNPQRVWDFFSVHRIQERGENHAQEQRKKEYSEKRT